MNVSHYRTNRAFLLPEVGVAKGVRATVGCAVRTILNKELRFPNGAHGAPYLDSLN